jgi:hypothetical protein
MSRSNVVPPEDLEVGARVLLLQSNARVSGEIESIFFAGKLSPRELEMSSPEFEGTLKFEFIPGWGWRQICKSREVPRYDDHHPVFFINVGDAA